MAFQVTPAHEAIFEAIRDGSANIQIEAVAGSGKTSTIVKALELIDRDESTLFLAFNRNIARELAKRCPSHVDVRTLNSLGHRAWGNWCYDRGIVQSSRQMTVDGEKLYHCVDELAEDEVISEDDARYCRGSAVKLARLAKSVGLVIPCEELAGGVKVTRRAGLVPDTDESWLGLVDHFNLQLPDIDDSVWRVITMAREILDLSTSQHSKIDFDDQLYLPFVYDAKPARHDRVFIDEAQDLSPLQHDLVGKALKLEGQLVAVGDPAQAIYGFRGADARSMDSLQERFECKRLPLHVSYRCPTAVVAMAQRVTPHIQAREGAAAGYVNEDTVTASKALEKGMIKGGAMILSRTTAPAVALCFALLRRKVPANVLGRDIGKGLLALIKKFRPDSCDHLLTKLDAWERRELERMTKRKASESAIEQLRDKAETLRVLAEEVEEPGTRGLDKLRNGIEYMFSDAPGEERVVISTIHKAKGLEAADVWVLNPHLMPHPMAKREWERVQERNMIYVAYTRSQESLRFLSYEPRGAPGV